MVQSTPLKQRYNTMYVKIHKSSEKELLAVCDEDIIGQTFEEGILQLKISESFYKGSIKSDTEVLELIKKFDNINLAGKNTVRLAIENEIIDEKNLIYINGIPHIQIYTF